MRERNQSQRERGEQDVKEMNAGERWERVCESSKDAGKKERTREGGVKSGRRKRAESVLKRER